jgi:hypothetical protein
MRVMSSYHRISLLTGLAGVCLGVLIGVGAARTGWLNVTASPVSENTADDALSKDRARAGVSGTLGSPRIAGFSDGTGSLVGEVGLSDVPMTMDDAVGGQLGQAFNRLVEKLKQLGVNDDLLVDLVSAEFNRRWDEKAEEVNRAYARGEMTQEERQLWWADREKGREAAIRLLMGDAAYERWDKRRVLQSFDMDLTGWTSEEQDSLYRLKKQFDGARHEQWLAHLRGELDPHDFRTQREASKSDYDQQMEALLGKDWYASYKYETDGSVAALRRDLIPLNVPVEGVDTLHAVTTSFQLAKKDLDAMLQAGQIDQAEHGRRLALARQQRDAGISGVLGSDGVELYNMARNRDYQTMGRFAAAWRLSEEDRRYVYTAMSSYRHATRSPPSGEEDMAARQQLVRETETALRRYLGDDRYEMLKRAGIIGL